MSAERTQFQRRLGVKKLLDEGQLPCEQKKIEEFGKGVLGTFGIDPSEMVGELTQTGGSRPLKGTVEKTATGPKKQIYGAGTTGPNNSNLLYIAIGLGVLFLVMRNS